MWVVTLNGKKVHDSISKERAESFINDLNSIERRDFKLFSSEEFREFQRNNRLRQNRENAALAIARAVARGLLLGLKRVIGMGK